MKIKTLRETYYEASGQVSNLCRQLAFAGIAIIWLLRIGNDHGTIQYSPLLTWPLYSFVLALALDLSQYLYKTIIFGFLNWRHWRKHKNNDADVRVSGAVNFITNCCFWGKASAMAFGYLKLLLYIQAKL